MVVMADDFFGTIGGGHLEHVALAHARGMLRRWLQNPGELGTNAVAPELQRWALGPSMGQCCGGVVYLEFTGLTASAILQIGQEALQTRPQVAVFGGGHVGDALLAQLLLLDYRVLGYDSRDAMFTSGRQANPLLHIEQVDPIADAVPDLPPRCDVLIMSFSHAEDLDLVDACLTRQKQKGDLGFLGLIGSASKWGRFQHRLHERGHTPDLMAQVHCPIGHPAIVGKEPAVIALAIAAQLALSTNPSRRSD